jgi:hypothetical protein
MKGKPEYRVRVRHHAKSLDKALPIILGFGCGMSERPPDTQKSTGTFFWKGMRWIIRGTRIVDPYDAVEIKPWGSDSSVKISASRFEQDEAAIIETLAEVRTLLEAIASGKPISRTL